MKEMKAANIEGFETCAFCDYSVILSNNIKIINCLNPECLKDTCRLEYLLIISIHDIIL